MKRKKKICTPEEQAAQTLKNRELAKKRDAKLAKEKELNELKRRKKHIVRVALRNQAKEQRAALRAEALRQRSERYKELMAKENQLPELPGVSPDVRAPSA